MDDLLSLIYCTVSYNTHTVLKDNFRFLEPAENGYGGFIVIANFATSIVEIQGMKNGSHWGNQLSSAHTHNNIYIFYSEHTLSLTEFPVTAIGSPYPLLGEI